MSSGWRGRLIFLGLVVIVASAALLMQFNALSTSQLLRQNAIQRTQPTFAKVTLPPTNEPTLCDKIGGALVIAYCIYEQKSRTYVSLIDQDDSYVR